MNICVITPSYPTKRKHSYTFVESLCNSFADLGHNVTVISPLDTLWRKRPCPYMVESYTSWGGVKVFTPKFLSLGMRLPFLREMYLFNLRKSIERTIKKEHLHIDVMYGHFWRSGLNAFNSAFRLNIPLYVATGESNIYIEDTDKDYVAKFSKYVKGVICVSTKNREESIGKGLTTNDKCIVLPNAIDNKLFFKKDKKELRKQYGFSDDDFIVIYVGYFIKRKGAGRLSAALEKLDGVKSIFIGDNRGQDVEEPYGTGILFKGAVPHKQLPDYLNCADVFVLPTLKEGCCNAIVEAMACGLPVISSDCDFNYDVLDDTNAILINPNDIDEIAKAIQTLRDDDSLRKRMADNSLIKANKLTITSRAKSILQFFKDRVT